MDALMDAAGRGEVDKVHEYLATHKSITETAHTAFNMTPLHVAAANGQLDVIIRLLEDRQSAINLACLDDLYRTPLHLAAYNNHGEVVKFFLSKQCEHVDVNAKAMYGIAPLHLSVMRRATAVTEILMSTHSVHKLAQTEDLFSVLHMAADGGQDHVVAMLAQRLPVSDIAKLVGPAMADRIKRTPLHYVARAGHTHVLRLLLHKPYCEFLNVNAEDADGMTALHLAARGGHTNVVVELLKCAGVSVNAKARNQHTQVSLVAPTDMELECLPRPSLADMKIELSDGFTPLHLAAREGHKGVVSLLLKCDEVRVNEGDDAGMTPLHLACQHSHAEIVKLLLEHPNCNVNAIANDRSTPLHLGVKSGNISTVIQLTRKPGIDCNGEDISGSTALDIAEREGYINLVFHLLEGPVEVRLDPEAEHLYSKQLDLAAQQKHAEIVKLLLEKIEVRVAFANNEHRKGQKLLHWAADNGYSTLMGHLLEWGNVTDLNVKDDLDNTPLHYASKKGHVKVVRLLLSRTDVDINAENQNLETPLHLAAKEGRTEVVKELSLEKSGRLRATEEDKYDRTALQLAVENGHKDIEKLLLERSDVREYVNGLYRDRQVYVDAANAILVGAALIASVTFAAWLQPPMGYQPYIPADASPTTPSSAFEVYADLQQHPNLQVFWIFNSLSFFFSIATVLAGAGGVLPMREGFIKEAVEKVRRALLWTALLLAGSVIFVLGAFATAGYAVLPPIPKYKNSMIATIAIGGVVCAISLGVFLLNLYQLRPEWWRTNVDKRLGLKCKAIHDSLSKR